MQRIIGVMVFAVVFLTGRGPEFLIGDPAHTVSFTSYAYGDMAMKWIDFPDEQLKVNGLAWWNEEKPSLRRLPSRLKDTFREPVWSLAQAPSGGRIRFRTDSRIIGIRAQSAGGSAAMYHMTLIAQSGFDLYLDSIYQGSAWPDASGKIDKEWKIPCPGGEWHDVIIYLPLYTPVTVRQIGVEETAGMEDPKPFVLKKPVVYYGSSITQGGCPSNPGMNYPAIVSRALNLDFVCLGFSGNGKGEPELAQAINEIDSSCIVLDHWANCSNLRENLPLFTGILRKKHPDVPIIVVGPYFHPNDRWEMWFKNQRQDAMAFVQQAKEQGDKNIWFLDGLEMIDKTKVSGLVDGVHANTLGHYFMAQVFTSLLKKILLP